MAKIDVQPEGQDGERLRFAVTVTEAGEASRHHVTLSREDYERWGRTSDSPEAFVRRCFEFLLEREPKESILSRFDVSVIGSYFPDFERRILRREG